MGSINFVTEICSMTVSQLNNKGNKKMNIDSQLKLSLGMGIYFVGISILAEIAISLLPGDSVLYKTFAGLGIVIVGITTMNITYQAAQKNESDK